MRPCEIGLNRDRTLEVVDGPVERFLGALRPEESATEVKIVRFGSMASRVRKAGRILRRQGCGDFASDGPRDLGLEPDHVVERPRVLAAQRCRSVGA